MSDATANALSERLQRLHSHLEQENPVLADAVESFQKLDAVARGLGMFGSHDSFASAVSWWPVIAVLGTFSSGKSSFINYAIGRKIQSTGNQAVDDKFTVLCYGNEEEPRVLPGLALDSDPRFPFYRISGDIEEVAEGEGRRLNSYLQLTTCNSEQLRGKIFIDSPGFDADAQRTSTLHIVGHIIDLSDLVLVFFDARHPEPGAMHDTLEHLVGETIQRPDATKFLYILNQIDITAREDNPEEVFGAWQRALAQKGLTAGRFYRIYNPNAAVPIEDEARRQRFEAKRSEDMAEIERRMQQVEVERAYRIVGVLEKTAKRLRDEVVPAIAEAKKLWKRRTLWGDVIALALLVGVPLIWLAAEGALGGLGELYESITGSVVATVLVLVALVLVVIGVHHLVRVMAAKSVRMTLRRRYASGDLRNWIMRAFDKNTVWWRPSLGSKPAGWSGRARKRLARVLAEADTLVQRLNDRFTNPSGGRGRGDDEGGGRVAAPVAGEGAPATPVGAESTGPEAETEQPAPARP